MVDVNTRHTHAVVDLGDKAHGITHPATEHRQYRLACWVATPRDTFTFIEKEWRVVRIAPVSDPANPFNIPLVFARQI